MLKTRKSLTVNGTSTFTDADGKEEVVATMSASIPEDGSVSTNRYIQNKDIYVAKKKEVQTDFTAFDEYVYGLLEV